MATWVASRGRCHWHTAKFEDCAPACYLGDQPRNKVSALMAANPTTNHLVHEGGERHYPLARSRPLRIALYYAVGGLIWVVISDQVLALMPAHSYTLNRLMFVSVNALLLYLVAYRYMKTIRISVAGR